ncbi:aquaporin-8-like [Haliotis rubra]|uniref:aquaporin-8-like n=1 Tax=Haliotis rubra TaxID=36100 RepID=UPI001EE51F50|nr:aquaporin-8-like [Haliotis rubra]
MPMIVPIALCAGFTVAALMATFGKNEQYSSNITAGSRLRDRYEQLGSTRNRPRSGRPRVTTSKTATFVHATYVENDNDNVNGIGNTGHVEMIRPDNARGEHTYKVLHFDFFSGGHFNPAVSVAVCVSGSLKPLLLPAYIVMQMLGGVAGAALAMVVEPDELFTKVLTDDYVEMAVGPGRAIACEFLLTAFVVIAVLLTTLEEKTKTHAAPTAVGFAYVVGILSGIRITGTSLNPARSFGSAVVLCLYSHKAWSNQYVFWVGPLLAAVVIAIFYRYVLFRRKTSSKDIYKYSHLMADPNQHD